MCIRDRAIARDMVLSVAHPLAGRVPLIGSPLKLSDTPVVEPVAPPLLGEHSSDVLGGLPVSYTHLDVYKRQMHE